jgi:hypothetical protein
MMVRTAAKSVFELEGSNFELTLTTYKYLAVLFYDNSELSRQYRENWTTAADEIASLPPDCEIAEVQTPQTAAGIGLSLLTLLVDIWGGPGAQ